MKLFSFEITKTFTNVVEVFANNESEAYEIAKNIKRYKEDFNEKETLIELVEEVELTTDKTMKLISDFFLLNGDTSYVSEIIDFVVDKEKFIVWFVDNFTMNECPFNMDEEDYEIVRQHAIEIKEAK